MKIHILLLFLAATSLMTYAQDTPTLRDSQEIQLLARRKVEKGLNDLLNTITFDDLGDFERNAIRADSYGDSPNKIFYDAQVIIEDDLNPEHDSRATTADLPVAKYLSNFDLFYPQSPDRTVVFTDIRVSNLKKSDYYYIKVYFTSQFTLQHKQVARPYRPLLRVAEVRAERKGTKWTAYITRVAFVTPEDQADETRNDVELAVAVSAPNQENENRLQEEAWNKEREQERKALAEYNRLLETGDKALAAGELDLALEAYTEAENRNNYDDLLPRRKLFQVKRALEKAKQTQAELLESYLKQGALAQKNRKYSEAVGLFKKAFDLKPDSVELGETIRQLNQKASVRSELDEKYNAGKYAEVIKDYGRLLKKDQQNSDHYLGRGLAYFKLNELNRALSDFNKAITLDFVNLPALRARAEVYVLKQDIPKAIADLSSFLNIDPTHYEVLNRRAELRILTRNSSGALDDFTRAIALSPAKAVYYFNRGALYDQLEDYPLALTDFTAAVQADQKYAIAWYRRGLVYMKMKQVESAGLDFTKLRTLGITSEQEAEINNLAKEYLNNAKAAFGSGEFATALRGFDDVIRIQPKISEAWYFKANTLLNQADSLQAIESFGQAIAYDETYTQAYFERAQVLFARGNFDLSAQDFKKAYTLLPSMYQALAGEADAYYAQKQFQQAIPLYESLKALEKKAEKTLSEKRYAQLYNQLGQSYFQLTLIDKAIDEYSRAIGKDENFSDAYYNRGLAYEAGNSPRKGIADYKKAAGLDSRNAQIYLTLGRALSRYENYQEAILSFSEAIEHDPQKSCCWLPAKANRADLYLITGQYNKAVEDFQHVFKTSPELATSQRLLNLATSLLWLKKTDEALYYLKTIQGEGEILPQVQYTLGCAHAQQFNQEEALSWLEKAFLSGAFTASFVRKDKLLEMCNGTFRNSPALKALITKYLKK